MKCSCVWFCVWIFFNFAFYLIFLLVEDEILCSYTFFFSQCFYVYFFLYYVFIVYDINYECEMASIEFVAKISISVINIWNIIRWIRCVVFRLEIFTIYFNFIKQNIHLMEPYFYLRFVKQFSSDEILWKIVSFINEIFLRIDSIKIWYVIFMQRALDWLFIIFITPEIDNRTVIEEAVM